MSNWTTERRLKALLVNNGNGHSGVSGPPLTDDTFRMDESQLSEEEDGERPGAYAITRCQNRIPETEWDPTDRNFDGSNHESLSSPEVHERETDCTFDALHPVQFEIDDDGKCSTEEKARFFTRRCLCIVAAALCCIASVAVFTSMLFHGEKRPIDSGNFRKQNCSKDQPDPSVQCECNKEISFISYSTKEHYSSVKSFDALWGRLDPDMSMSSCDPANIALVWVSLEYQKWKEQGLEQWKERITSRLALAWLYFSSGGKDWTNKTNWTTPQSECTWYGITCDAQNNVIGVSLPRNNLEGPLGTWVALLPYLKTLDLTSNRLSGSIPWEISSFSKIEDLRLGTNALTGSLPSHMSAFTNLRFLHLYENLIGGPFPSQLFALTALKELSLYSTRLSGTFPSTGWGRMSQLEILDLNFINGLEGRFPSSVTLTNLKTLKMGGLLLFGTVPESIGSMIALESLTIQSTPLTGNIPSSMANLSNLKFFDITYSSFTGTIPFEFGNCTQLEEFLASDNYLTGTIPTDLARMTRLRTLNVANNKVSGKLPEGLSNITTLMTVQISNTEVNALPSLICNNSKTIYLSPTSPIVDCDCCTIL